MMKARKTSAFFSNSKKAYSFQAKNLLSCPYLDYTRQADFVKPVFGALNRPPIGGLVHGKSLSSLHFRYSANH
jgi:hypothetical protein